jgi:HAE1 family hydrophobic/amphiphilic exporter-1
MLTIIVLGFFSIFQIKKESAPEVDFPIAYITTLYPGASAEDVEELVTDKIESQVLSVSDISEISSVSQNSVSVIIVQFDTGTDSYKKINEVKDEVDKANLPDDAEDPQVEEISFNNFPIMRYSLTGNYDLSYLKILAEDLAEEIETIPGISKVEISGGEEREIQIIVDRKKIDNYGLSVIQVTQAISSANTDIPIGSIKTSGEEFNIAFSGKINNVEDVKNIPITILGGTPIFVKDVADVVDGIKEVDTMSFLSVDGEDGTPAVSLGIYKTTEADTINISKDVREKITFFEEQYFPEGVSIINILDQADAIQSDLSGLLNNGLGTILIVFLVLLIFVGFRESILASLVIPFSFLITFIVLYNIGYTLNFITLFSLILALGILVDSAIVVVEEMNYQIRKGRSAKEAAINTINEFKMPLISGTLTTVFVFVPMLLVSGIMGDFLAPIPVTVSVVLLSSLFVALSLITTLSLGLIKTDRKERKGGWGHKIIRKLIDFYESILNKIFNNVKIRKTFISVVIILFVFSLMLPTVGLLKIDLFADSGADNFSIDIEEPYGTTLDRTLEKTREVEGIVLADDRIDTIQLNIGSKSVSSLDSLISSSGENNANLYITLKEGEDSVLVVKDLREKFNSYDFGAAKVSIVEEQSGPSSGAPIQITITGDGLEDLDIIATDLENVLKNIPGVINISNSNVVTNGKFTITIDRVKAKLYGLNTSDVAYILRNAVSGVDASIMREDGDSVDIVVKYDLDEATMDMISSITVPTQYGDIPLKMFISTDYEGALESILHEDGNRVVTISAYTEDGYSSNSIISDFDKQIQDYYLPLGYSISYGGDVESIEQSFSEMIQALFIGVFAILMLLVWQFNSFKQPFFVLTTIPLTIIGIFPLLTIFNIPLSFPGLVGIVALAGIVVNNAIILIDKINKNRLNNLSKEEAIIDAAKSRIKPIILTTLTTIGGLAPLCFADPTWSPIAYSIIFGLIFSSLLTLVFVPILYNKFEK